MSQGDRSSLVHCGHEISRHELEELKETVELFRGLSRWELAQTVCEHLGWMTATGAPKVHACLKLLDKLDAQGLILLPAKRPWRHKETEKASRKTDRTNPENELSATLADLAPIDLEVASDKEDVALFNEYVDRYHYLGYKRPFGCFLRYFIVSRHARLGCVLVAGAAKSIRARDRWIGWGQNQRLNNLPWVVNNTRFLIFPWVRVRHLASHVLGQVARRLRQDWYERWGYRPVLLETFVDPARYQGTCYQAAGWISLGETTGEGLLRPGRDYATTPKLIYVRPLMKDFRLQLSSLAPPASLEQSQQAGSPFASTF